MFCFNESGKKIVLNPCTRSHFQQILVQLTNPRLNIYCVDLLCSHCAKHDFGHAQLS